MKKKILATGLSFAMLFSSLIGFAGCEDGEHKHNFEAVAKKEATCTEAGYEAYYKCSECEKLFSDDKGETEIEAPKAIAAAHKITAVDKKDETCTETGTAAHYKCTVCNKLFSDAAGKNEIAAPETIPVKAHTIEEVAKKRPTCTEAGYEEHYKCTVCGALFLDEEGTTPTDEDSLAIPAAHRIVEVPQKDANCTEAGYEAHFKCELCNKLFSDNAATTEISAPVTIPINGKHNVGFGFTHENTPIPATDGGTLQSKCLICGQNIETINYAAGCNIKISSLSAQWKLENAGYYYYKAPTDKAPSASFGFHATKAGTYKITVLDVESGAGVVRFLSKLYISTTNYVTSAAETSIYNETGGPTPNDWASSEKAKPLVDQYKSKITLDGHNPGTPTTMKSISFTFTEADIGENGIYISFQLLERYQDENEVWRNATTCGAYLVKFDMPAEQAQP